MTKIIAIISIVILVLVMLGVVAFALFSKPKAPVTNGSETTASSFSDLTTRQYQADDANTKVDIGQLATALQAYYTTPGKGSYPSQTQGFNQVVVSGDLKYVPMPVQKSISYQYQVIPAGCLGTKASPCTDIAVWAPLLTPSVAGNIWCWQSKTGVAKEVAPGQCTL